MQYSPTIFAKAFCEVLLKTPESQYNELCNNFTSVLKKHGAIKDSNKIFQKVAIKKPEINAIFLSLYINRHIL